MNMQFNSTQELVAALAPIATPNSFAASLVASFNYWGDLTIRQKAAAERMLAPKETVNAGAIEALLGTAKNSGIKRPVFRADGLAFSLAPLNGRNAGAVYVKEVNGSYMGKIAGGIFVPSSDAPASVASTIIAVAADPRGTAIAFGKETGNCACCGRPLSDPTSVELGIGPICISKWGL